jgi:hypothetical protein
MALLALLMLILYRIIIVGAGICIAWIGMDKFRSSRAKMGEAKAEYKGFKLFLRNMNAGGWFIVFGLVVIIIGLATSPTISLSEKRSDGSELIWNIHHLFAREATIGELLKNPKKFEDSMVKVKGLTGESMMKGGEKESMIFTLEDGAAKVKVFSEKVEFFRRGVNK